MTSVKIEKEGQVRFAGDLQELTLVAKMNGIIGTRLTMSDGTVLHFRLKDKKWRAMLLRKGDLVQAMDVHENGSDIVHFGDGIKWAFVSRTFHDVLGSYDYAPKQNAEVSNG